LPWHLLVWRSQGQVFLQEYIVKQQLQRFLGQGFTYSSPVWYYLIELPFAMFPWIVFAPAGWWVTFRSGRQSPKIDINCSAAMWAVWAVVILVFFSLSQTKLPQYLLPVLPALCMLVAMRLETAWKNRWKLCLGEATSLGLIGISLGGLFIFVYIISRQLRAQSATTLLAGTGAGAWLAREREAVFITLLGPQWLAVGILVLLGSVVMLFFWQRINRIVFVGVLTNSLLAVIVLHSALPVWSRHETAPVNELAQRTLSALECGEYLVIYEANSPTPYRLRFQLGHPQQIESVVLRHELPPALEKLQHGYVIAPQKAVFNPLTVELRQEARAGSWILWRFDRKE
jgi:4-amino-4-deoxy-L-arabinose transferase-like glycosyltransferase